MGAPPAHRLVGDDELDDGQRIEHSNGGNVPEVDLVFLPQHPLVLAGQVGHAEVLLEGEAG